MIRRNTANDFGSRTLWQRYREAVSLLRKVRELMVRLGREIEFTIYLDKVRAAHKAKRNFMKLLDRARF
jgi:uncharacterized Zn finger protein